MLGITAISLCLNGCGTARVAQQAHPSAQYANPVAKAPSEVAVYHDGDSAIPAYIRLANLGSHGNGYANDEILIEKLKVSAAAMGADLIVLVRKEITSDETVGSYGGGIFISDQIKRPHMYALAGVHAKSAMGIRFDQDGKTIAYVTSGSAADKAGLKEGMRLLAINGDFFGDRTVAEKHIFSKEPGESAEIEVADLNGEKRRFELVLQEAR